MNVAEHIEMHFGPMERGCASASLPGVQICVFRNQRSGGVMTLATLGLSSTILALNEPRRVRQELLFAARDEGRPEGFVQVLLEVAEHLQTRGRAALRGEVLPLHNFIAADSGSKALYASIPVAFPETLATLRGPSAPVVFVWLL